MRFHLTVLAIYWKCFRCCAIQRELWRTAISPTRSADIVGTYQPLESGFNYKELGVVPKPVSAYK